MGQPVVGQRKGLFPVLGWVVQERAENLRGLAVKFEQRIQRADRHFFFGHLGQAGDALAPAQFHPPYMTYKLLHVRCSANAARQIQQRRVGLQVFIPKSSRLIVPGEKLFQ